MVDNNIVVVISFYQSESYFTDNFAYEALDCRSLIIYNIFNT